MIQPQEMTLPSQEFQAVAAEIQPAPERKFTSTESLLEGLWNRHKLTVGAMRLRGFADPDLHTKLTLHRHGIMTERANGATTIDGTPTFYTRDHLEQAGLIDTSGGLTELGSYTLHFLENPQENHLWKHRVSDVLQAYIDAHKPKHPAPGAAL